MLSSNTSMILWRYAAIERAAQNLIESHCGLICANCGTCCCRADICEEAFDSTLLMRLHGEKKSSVHFSDRTGWLTEQGCTLGLGRPPVCYEFFCDDILGHLPDDTHRYVLQTLGKLVSHVAYSPAGKSRLINLRTDEELEQMSHEPFCERYEEAKAALLKIQMFYHVGELGPDGVEPLRKINEPPPSLT